MEEIKVKVKNQHGDLVFISAYIYKTNFYKIRRDMQKFEYIVIDDERIPSNDKEIFHSVLTGDDFIIVEM